MRALLVFTLLLSGLAQAGLRPGTWRPVSGDLGSAAVTAIAQGGDGARYAASGGWIYRQPTPSDPWRTVGPYGPQLRWDEGQHVEAVGPFPQAWLDQVSEDAFQALEAMAGNEVNEDSLTEDAARLLLRAYVEETDPDADSPYRIVALATASDGVWVVTGAGVLRASALGVRGPVGTLKGARAAVVSGGDLWVALADRLVKIGADGVPQAHRIGAIEALAADDAGLVFVADGTVWTWAGQGEPQRQPTPTGRPQAVAAHGAVRWAATPMALYRWAGSEWRLCPPTATTPRKLVAGPHGLVVVGEARVLFVDPECRQLARQDPPWPGGMALLDALVVGDDVWLATAAGLQRLVDASVSAADAARVGGFQRALRALPTLEEVSAAALRYQQLDARSRGFGWRPILRGLLPDVTVNYVSHPFRIETRDAFTRDLLLVDVQQTNPQWIVLAEWTLRFDLLGMMFEVERASSLGELDTGAADADAEAQALVAQTDLDATDGLDGTGAVDDGDVFVDTGLSDDTAAAVDTGVAFALLAVERRQAERDRQRLLSDISKLYRERLRVMFRLWVQLEPDGLHLPEVMRLREVDARLDALTGGVFTRWAPALR